jgi:hypothetical protein
VARIGEKKNVQNFGVKTRRKETIREARTVDGRMGSKWILGRLAGGAVEWIHLAQDRLVAGCCEHGDEHSGYGATELVTIDIKTFEA